MMHHEHRNKPSRPSLGPPLRVMETKESRAQQPPGKVPVCRLLKQACLHAGQQQASRCSHPAGTSSCFHLGEMAAATTPRVPGVGATVNAPAQISQVGHPSGWGHAAQDGPQGPTRRESTGPHMTPDSSSLVFEQYS